MPRNHMSWYYCIYSPELKDAKDAYRQTPNWSGEILQEFEKTLQDAWSIKDFPDMIIPRESVRDLRGAIIKGLHELREALITEKDKAPVPGQPHPCTVTVELWQRRLEHRIVRLRLREHQVSRCEGSRSLERRDHVAREQSRGRSATSHSFRADSLTSSNHRDDGERRAEAEERATQAGSRGVTCALEPGPARASGMRNGVHADADTWPSSPTKSTPPRYRKVLFLRQPYPDNHVDASFLRDLKRNVNVHPANLPALLRQTLPITQHVASIFIFVVVFVRLSRASLSASALLTICAILSGTLRAWAWAIGEPTAWAGITSSLTTAGRAPLPPSTPQNGNGPCCNGDETRNKPRPTDTTAPASASPVGTLIPLVALYLLSPALKTLTRATTSDSIWALSGTLFTINVFLGDYRAIPTSSSFRQDLVPRWFSRVSKERLAPEAEEPLPRRGPYFARRAPLPSTLSLTAALSGSTVLASRLPSNAQVFSLLLFSTLWFGPFPLLRSSLTLRPTLILTYCLSAIALVGLSRTVGTGGTVLASAILFGTSVVAPLVRGWLHVRYKDRLSGPWDVVPPKVNNNAHGQQFDFSAAAVNGGRIDTAMPGRIS